MKINTLHSVIVARLVWGLAITLFLVISGSYAAASGPNSAEKPIYVVVMKQGPDSSGKTQALGQEHKALHFYHAVFNGFSAELSEAAVSALSRNPLVEFVEKAHIVKLYAESYPSGVDRIDADLAHPLSTDTRGSGARVAIVDTGIDFTHEDLAGQIDINLSATFVSRGKTTENGVDDHGHGTHVAGTVAAILNNSKGVVGVAPEAQLISLKVLSKNGFGSSADIIAALDYITNHNNAVASTYNEMIHVANFSIGGSGSDSNTAYRRAFDAAVDSGCFIVVAAGNESDDAANHVPAAYDSVFTVSAMNPLTDDFASFSNFGNDIDMTAPGTSISSTLLGGGYGSKSGTSMATPHVAGVAALYVAKNLASLTPESAVGTIRTALIASAEPLVMNGDTDGIAEPLADARAIVGTITQPDPALHISVSTDKSSYTETDTTAYLTATVVDQTNNPVTGLDAAAFNLGAFIWSFAGEISTGTYSLNLEISSFPLGDTLGTLTVEAAPLSDSADFTIRKANPSAIFVSSISHDKVFKNLRIYVRVQSTEGSFIEGAEVGIAVTTSSGAARSFSKTTGTNGTADYRWANAPDGVYTIEILNVFKDGTIYEATLDDLSGATFTIP